ncbi:MAG: agmatinase [Chloroflexi bacterium]|nr:agmatinase [Chloroflexota bacterium]
MQQPTVKDSAEKPNRYQPVDSLASPRFAGVRTFMRLPYVTDLDGVDVAFAGLPFDTGASFKVGARFGPEAIRSASALLRPYHPELDLEIFKWISAIDYGDAPVAPGFIEDSYERIVTFLQPLHAAGVVPIALGGDHSIALPELRAAAQQHGPLALVLGHRYFHGTPFKRAVEEGLLAPERSTMIGMRGPLYDRDDLANARAMGFKIVTAEQMHRYGIAELPQQILARVSDHPTFLSFDIDFLDPAYAPGTGTPEVGGFATWQAQLLLRGLAGLNIAAADVVEVLPAYDHGQVTAHAAANMAWEILSLVAWKRKQSR